MKLSEGTVNKIPIYQVDAFTSRAFGGNPAAVCVLESYPDDALLQSIALENNLSETAFLVQYAARMPIIICAGLRRALKWHCAVMQLLHLHMLFLII